jgi:hypothetical protein
LNYTIQVYPLQPEGYAFQIGTNEYRGDSVPMIHALTLGELGAKISSEIERQDRDGGRNDVVARRFMPAGVNEVRRAQPIGDFADFAPAAPPSMPTQEF